MILLRRSGAAAGVALAVALVVALPAVPAASVAAAPGAAAPAPPHAAAAAATVPPRLFGRDWVTIPTTRRVVALTFDAGYSDAGLTPILRALAAARVRATFFVTGVWARLHPDGVRRIVAAGHVIANHSSTHPHFPRIPVSSVRRELADADAAVRRATAGRAGTVPWFRFPYGEHSAASIRAVNRSGYVCVGYTYDTAGWLGTSAGQSRASVLRRAMKAVRPGGILLMHVGEHPRDHSTLDADTLPAVIAAIRAQGYGFTTVEALLSPASG